MPTISTAKTCRFSFSNSRSIKLTWAVDNGGVILLIDGEVVYLLTALADVTLDTRVFLKRNFCIHFNTKISSTTGGNIR